MILFPRELQPSLSTIANAETILSLTALRFEQGNPSRRQRRAAAIDGAQVSGATALNLLQSPLFYAHRHLIMERATAAHLPTIYDFPEVAEEGGFAAYGPRLSALNEITARQAENRYDASLPVIDTCSATLLFADQVGGIVQRTAARVRPSPA